ncbi:cytoplasmic dynein 2 intermediate chain 1-like [Palaemon carinicauda]|uniref:cytoplasmic dynein 2 intermediate chain 1-like n=1 Tax=Palaemon carinicauda TaxID=392227 RepID=UPI0035B5B39F
MRDREKASKPSRSSTNGAEKPKTKSSSKSQPTKSGPPKSSSSGASKSSTSGAKKPTSSSSKSSTATKSQSSSSRTPKTAASTSSSKSRSTVELKPEKLSSRSKPDTSGSKDERSKRASDKKSSEAQGSQESNKNDRASTKKDKGPSRSSREPSRGDRSSSRKTEKDSSTSRSNKPSSRSKGASERNPSREDKSSKSQGRSKDRSRPLESKKSDSTSSDRREASKEKPTKSSKDSSKSKSVDKSDIKKSSRSDSEKVKDKSKSSKGESKEKSNEESSNQKSSRSRGKSAKRSTSRKEESLIEDRGQQEVEAVEQNQNSLETMESGISMSTPRDLSGDEAEIEESISSKMVEVDEVAEEGLQDDDEAMIDDSASQDPFMDESFPDDLHYQNALGVPASLVSHSDIPRDNDEENTKDIEESIEEQTADNDVMPKENGIKEPEVEEPNVEEPGIEEDYYEDEFEDYESDFENDTGSGNEDEDSSSSSTSTPASSSSPSSLSSSSEESDEETRDPDLEAVLQAMKKENNFSYPLERVYTFDDPTQDERPLSPVIEEKKEVVQDTASKSAPQPQEKPNTNVQRPKTSRTFVNFAVAKKRQEAAHAHSKMNSRGRILLSMIQLDTVSVDLLTLAPVSYEAYISSFGHSNRQQVNVQTNEDALSEEIQTEPIVTRNKWTQKPVHITIGEDNVLPGPEDYMGVGGDMGPLTFTGASSRTSGTSRLTSFLTSASQVMLALLEEELVWETAESNKSDSSATSEGLGFSQPPVTLGQNVQSLLEGRTTPFVKFCPNEPNLLLSGHGLHSLGEESIEDFKDGGLLCVWWVQEPSRPQHLLSCCSTPTAASFSPARPSLIIAGLEDGSLASWDLRESLQLHTLKINIDKDNWRVRVPSYITACDESGEGEGSSIVAIHTVTTDEDQASDTHGAFQVVTLTANGRVTWWVVMHVPLTTAASDISIGRKSATVRTINNTIAVSPHIGASPWARIVINRAATINVAHALYGDEAISSDIICHDLKMDINEPSQLYVATGSGAVAHCSRHSSRIHPKAYYPEFEPGCESLCISLCPHDYRYMLVGSSDGMVRLHSISSERPLTTWQSAPDCAPIKELQWSPARPCVFYVLDAMARLHVWDLSAGDIFPILTVEAGGLVGGALRSFNIAPTQPTSRHPLYAIFASDGGEMVLRQVGPEFSTHHLQDDYDTELERFTYYVNII